MALIKSHKFVNSLPAQLEADAIYFVRKGVGYEQYVTNGSGTLVAYPANYLTTIKTVNGESLVGEGDLVIESGSGKLSATNPVIEGSITEDVYAISGTTPAIDPANGTIQTWALTGASTPTDSLSSGQSLTLMINDGTDYTITWPSVVWVGGSAPTLAPTGYTVIELWKVGSTLYGALVGSIA